ncbi:uncharacterized protein LOC132265754 [Phlebotomus argentipes]|uniref:uncharacterized protein LOC132265754 n=1 Tax=Phlebotomus argentipes TaxID=94469 RepID=UPI0028932FDE|nr:uncharacterized protein LOC132265754 [Phlebotomus argentipes]
MFKIKITQFVNPHLFYYYNEEDELLPKPHEVKLMEILPNKQTLDEMIISYKPKLHEIVAHYNPTEKKWIRAQVDYITQSMNNEKIYFLFALDYGYSMESIGKWLWPLPQGLKEASKIIYMGGIKSIVPCKLGVNPVNAKVQMQPLKHWSKGAIIMFSKMLDSCHAVHFQPEMKRPNGQIFGQLQLTTLSLQDVDVASVLMQENFALASDDFVNDLVNLGTTKFERWHDNDRNAVNFGLSTVSQRPNYVTTEKIVEPEDEYGTFYGSWSSEEKKELTRISRYHRRNVKAKVSNWCEQNERLMAVESGADEVKSHNQVIQELKIVDVPVKKHRSMQTPILEADEEADESDSKPQVDLKSLIRALQEEPEPQDTTNLSSRTSAMPLPGGAIRHALFD